MSGGGVTENHTKHLCFCAKFRRRLIQKRGNPSVHAPPCHSGISDVEAANKNKTSNDNIVGDRWESTSAQGAEAEPPAQSRLARLRSHACVGPDSAEAKRSVTPCSANGNIDSERWESTSAQGAEAEPPARARSARSLA